MLNVRHISTAILLVLVLAVAGDEASAATDHTGTSYPTRCVEDMPCWSWSTMGNRKRGIVTVYGTPKVVGPCGYRRVWERTPRSMRGLLGPTLKGDRWARRHGCIGNVQNW